MVVTGNSRGNGKQLGDYLLAANDNTRIQIIDVAGWDETDERTMRRTLLSMSLTSELTRSDKGLYHAQINPAYGEDQNMTVEQWRQAADILSKQLQLDEQRRVIVLHTKKGRTHAHVVWERYDFNSGIMISDSFSHLAQNRARQELEITFGHKRTPERNKNRPVIKEKLTDLWRKFQKGHDFIKAAAKEGYIIAKGVKRPFRVVDENGRSFNLVKQIDNVKTKEVRDRLKGERLITEKEAIAQIRDRQTSLTQEQDNKKSDSAPQMTRDEMINNQVLELKKKKYLEELMELKERYKRQRELGKERD